MKILPKPVSAGLAFDPSGKRLFVHAKAANHPLGLGESGQVFTNRGAGGAVTFTLPPKPYAGAVFTFFLVVNQQVNVEPGDYAFVFDAAAQIAGKQLQLAGIASAATVVFDGTAWLVIDPIGTVSMET